MGAFAISPRADVRIRGLALGRAETLSAFFVRETEFDPMASSPTTSASADGLLTVAPIFGTNEHHSDLVGTVGTVGTVGVGMAGAASSGAAYSLGARHAGPITKDHTWLFLGANPRSTDESLPLAATLAHSVSPDQGGSLLGAATLRNDSIDSLAIAAWTSKFNNAKTQVDVALGTARQTPNEPVTLRAAKSVSNVFTKTGGSLSLIQRAAFSGNHEFRSAVEGYSETTEATGSRANSAAAAVVDSWQFRPNLTFEVGARRADGARDQSNLAARGCRL